MHHICTIIENKTSRGPTSHGTLFARNTKKRPEHKIMDQTENRRIYSLSFILVRSSFLLKRGCCLLSAGFRKATMSSLCSPFERNQWIPAVDLVRN